jgi:acyl-CoA synthetase (AMP-forming)/AMP-acid ligase II/acyl carrier protein
MTRDQNLFVDDFVRYGNRTALLTAQGERLTYHELARRIREVADTLAGERRLLAVESRNEISSLIAYLAALQARQPVLLLEDGATERDSRIVDTFHPQAIFRPAADGAGQFHALPRNRTVSLHPDLCVLLSTSGSTGSPKLVRLSHENIRSNARAIAHYLGITTGERAVTTLPFHYSFGMSVVNSHLAVGATLLLTDDSVTRNEFWEFFSAAGATSFSGVPYTFEMLERIGFRDRDYPTLRHIAQAGGRLPRDLVVEYAEWGRRKGVRLWVMYGQTEASPRMAYVPPDQVLENPECIGVPIPGGQFQLADTDGKAITADGEPGELVYRGPNVMLGYAREAADLGRGRDIQELRTGDLACRKANGLYYIVGRQSRFSKLFGLRISHDELEEFLRSQGFRAIVCGNDRLIVVATLDRAQSESIAARLSRRYPLAPGAIQVIELDEYPTLPSGKFDYQKVIGWANAGTGSPGQPRYRSLLEAFRALLKTDDITDTDSFLDLGGDSMLFVELSIAIENYLGVLPENWEALSISGLERLKSHDAAAHATPFAQKSRRFWVTVAAIFALFVLGEAAVQVRAYFKTGRSAANLALNRSLVIQNEALGLRTYRPNHTVENYAGKDGRFVTNSFGFRSPEISPIPAENELRIIVAGASTVAGAYARQNRETFPGRLESLLRGRFPGRTINVVNAGIEGYDLAEIGLLEEKVLLGLHPDILVIYPGFNDMAEICRSAKPEIRRQGLPYPTLPKWVLSGELVSKNTVGLRNHPTKIAVDPRKHSTEAYRKALDAIIQKALANRITPVLVTVARPYRKLPPNPPDELNELAATSLYYFSCLDLRGLFLASRIYNDQIRDAARAYAIPVVDLASLMPEGKDYFVDWGHFTKHGEEVTARLLLDTLPADPRLSAFFFNDNTASNP